MSAYPNLIRITAVAAAALVPFVASAQTSTYTSMTVAGDWQGFNAGQVNMQLVSNNTWRGDFYIAGRAKNTFKFVANGSFDAADWGSFTEHFTNLPYTGTASFEPGFGGDIAHYKLAGGHYRFIFNDATRQYTVSLLGYTLPYTNRVRNGSFEDQGEFSEYDAAYWKYFQPDPHGDAWGSASRQNFRAFPGTGGSYEMIIGTSPNFGGVWQDATAGEGFTYTARGQFWADTEPPYGPWLAEAQEIKIEFYNAYFNQLGFVSESLQNVGSAWTEFSVSGVAPPDTAWARTVVYASGANNAGSLQFDLLSIEESPPRAQTFDSGFLSYTGNHSQAGWVVQNGSVVTNGPTETNDLIFAGGSVKLESLGAIFSPRIATNVAQVTFFFRHGDTNEVETTNAISMEISASHNGSDWHDVAEPTNVLNLSYSEISISMPETVPPLDLPPRYVRIRKTGGIDPLYIDNVDILTAAQSSRFLNFETWTNNASDDCHSIAGWNLCTGRVVTAGAYEGNSGLILNAPNTNNYLQSPYFDDGYGSISFYYARGTNGGGPAKLLLQSSTDGATWTTVDTIDNINATSYKQYNRFFYRPDPGYLRLLNFPVIVTGGSTTLIDEEFNGGSSNPPAGWTLNSIGQYTTAFSSGRNPPSLKFDGSSDYLETPTVSNPTNLAFWYKGQSTSGGSSFTIEGWNGSSWVHIDTINPLNNSTGGQNVNYPVSSTFTKFKFSYSKDAGNVAFDDVIITGATGGGDPLPQDVLVDNVNVGEPLEYRTQNFDDWPRKGSYTSGTDFFQGWSVFETIVDANNTYLGQVGRMDDNSTAYIQSHEYPDGYGNISFKYRAWDDNPTANFVLEASFNGGSSWSNIASISTSATTYQDYDEYFYNTNPVILRWSKTSGERVLLDQIVIDRPKPPADIQINTYIDPAAPFTNDAVTIGSVIFGVNGANNIEAVATYRVNGGGWLNLSMTNVDYGVWETVSQIPAQTNGTIVEYYVTSTFGGPNSDLNSPKTNPVAGASAPYVYVIPRAKPGQVWINEVNYDSFFDFSSGQFIELAGPTGFNISGWAVEVRTGSATSGFPIVLGHYPIPATTLLPSDTATVGFWVIGQTNNQFGFGLDVANRDMQLTNDLYQIPLGIALQNEAGGLEQFLAFEGTMLAASKVDESDNFSGDTGVSLVGTGLSYAAFVWEGTDGFFGPALTPGAVNDGQQFGDGLDEIMDPPDIYYMAATNGNMYIRSAGNTNGWNVAPYSVAALKANPQNWQPVTPFGSSASGSTNQVWFAIPASNNVIYRLRYEVP